MDGRWVVDGAGWSCMWEVGKISVVGDRFFIEFFVFRLCRSALGGVSCPCGSVSRLVEVWCWVAVFFVLLGRNQKKNPCVPSAPPSAEIRNLQITQENSRISYGPNQEKWEKHSRTVQR